MCKLFADDCKIYGVVDLPRNMSPIQSDLNDLSNWSECWQHPFDETKCKAIHFGFHNPRTEYNLNNQTLEVIRDLGIIIDDTLRFHQHTACVVKKVNQVLRVIKHHLIQEMKLPLPRVSSQWLDHALNTQMRYGDLIFRQTYSKWKVYKGMPLR